MRDDNVVVILSLEGHPLVLPRKHVPNLCALDDETAGAVMRLGTNVARVLREVTGCEGINLVLLDGAAAGQDVFHLHLHVKPRWTGDGVVLRWNPATVAEMDRARLADAMKDRLSG